MTVAAEFDINEAFLKAANERNKQKVRGSTRRNWTGYAVLGIIATMLILHSFRTQNSIMLAVTILIGLFCAVFPSLAWRGVMRNLQQSPLYNERIRLIVSDEGLFTESSKVKSLQYWSAFTELVEFPDGLLLFQGPGSFNWLPISAFENPADYDEARRIISRHVSNHKII
jgi:hypothetical protein